MHGNKQERGDKVKTFDVGIYIEMYDYHDVEGNQNGKDGMFYTHIQAENSQEAMDKVQNDCIESNCPYTCEPHTAKEVKEFVYN